MMKNYCLSLFISALFFIGCAERKVVVESELESPLIANDISNQKVSSFAEDAQGHIWMGTFRGLNRYNVHEFHQYFCTDEQNSLPDNQIQTLYKDSRDRLWISTVNGMALYTEQDNFKRIPMETASRNSVQILEDKSGRIYINTSVSLCRYDEDREAFVDLLSLINNGFSIASHCFITPSNDLLLASSMSIKMFDVETMQLKDSVAVQNYPGYYAMMKDGRLWMSSYAGLAIYNTNTFAFEEVPEIIRNCINPLFLTYASMVRHPLYSILKRMVCFYIIRQRVHSGISPRTDFRLLSQM